MVARCLSIGCGLGAYSIGLALVIVLDDCVCTVCEQLLGMVISVAYYILRKREIKRQAAVMMDDSNVQAMVSLTQSYY